MIKEVIKLAPYVKSAIWGGDYFQQYGKSDLDVVAELWELAVRFDQSSKIVSGVFKGKMFDKIVSKEDLGPACDKYPYFPLLIKLIDAKDNLSIQVHPDDKYALKNEKSFGKTEMWYIISAEPGAGLCVGLKKDYTKKEIKQFLKNNDILSALNFFEVKEGDVFVIEPGTIHAIGEGVRLIEIQQNSDLTYRLYDYLRKDKNGKYRELHIKKAIDVIDYHKYQKPVLNTSLLAETEYFKVQKQVFDKELEIKTKDSFISFTFLKGKGNVNDIPYKEYDTFFLPYGCSCKIVGTGEVIITEV